MIQICYQCWPTAYLPRKHGHWTRKKTAFGISRNKVLPFLPTAYFVFRRPLLRSNCISACSTCIFARENRCTVVWKISLCFRFYVTKPTRSLSLPSPQTTQPKKCYFYPFNRLGGGGPSSEKGFPPLLFLVLRCCQRKERCWLGKEGRGN